MALARVGVHTGTNTGFASTVTTASWTATAGNMLIAIAQADTVAQNGITISGNNSTSWTRVISTALAATFDLEVWVAYNIAGGAGQTVTAADNGGGVDSLIIVEEWSGAAISLAADKSAGATDATGLSTTPNSGASSATTQADEVVIGATCVAGAPTLTLGSGYTNLTQVATTFTTLGFESKIVSATGAQTATFTAGVAGSWGCQVATFKQATTTTNTTDFFQIL